MVHTNVHRNLQQQKLLFTPQIKANIRVSRSHFPRGEVKYKLYARISFSFSGRFLSKMDLISALMALTAKGRRGRASVDKHLLEFQFPNSMGFSYVFFFALHLSASLTHSLPLSSLWSTPASLSVVPPDRVTLDKPALQLVNRSNPANREQPVPLTLFEARGATAADNYSSRRSGG